MNWYNSKLLVFKMIAHHRDHMMSYSSTLSLRNNAVKKSNVCLHLGKFFLQSLFWHRRLLWVPVEISLRLVALRLHVGVAVLLFWWRHNQVVIVDVLTLRICDPWYSCWGWSWLAERVCTLWRHNSWISDWTRLSTQFWFHFHNYYTF